MKTLRLIFWGLFIFYVLSGSAGAQEPGARLITVSGEAEIKVTPDEVILVLGIETLHPDLSAAKNDNDQKVRKIIALAKKMKIPDGHIQTDYISIEPRYDNRYEKKGFVGFLVRKTMTVRLRDITLFEELLSNVLQAGANYIHGVHFRTTQLRPYRDQARALAIKAAKNKAAALAKELDIAIGRPYAVREGRVGWDAGYNSWWGSRSSQYASQGQYTNTIQEDGAFSGSSEDGTIALGQISVYASVTVAFELEN